MTTLLEAVNQLEKFADGSLKRRIASLQMEYVSQDKVEAVNIANRLGIDVQLLESALAVKRVAGEINVIVHAVGILVLLPYILTENEKIESLSLGAGNTGIPFDLETNYRVAEFKFIHWRGHDSIRQNSIFKDFYKLAEAETVKQRFLYVIDDKYPLKFLRGRRLLKSVMSKDQSLLDHFRQKYGDQYTVTADYYSRWEKDWVKIEDVTRIVPNFATILESADIES